MKIVLTLLVVFVMAAPNLSFHKQRKYELFGKIIQDSIIRDIPSNKQSGKFKKALRNFETAVKLSPIENGADSIEIRIWNAYSRSYKFQLLRLTKKNSEWRMEFYNVRYKPNTLEDSIVSMKTDVLNGSPKSGWPDFIKVFFDLGVTSLPDWSKIPGYAPPSDGGGPTVEITTKKAYKIYSYFFPKSYSKRFEHAKKMADIMRLLEVEFGITWS